MSSDVLYEMFSGMSEAEIAEQLVPIITGFYIFSIVAQVLMLIIAGVTAHKKGRSVIGCLILTWFLGLIGLIITACMRSKKTAPSSSRTTSRPSGGGSATFGSSSGSSSSSTARPSGSGSSSTPTPTFGRGSSGGSSSSSSSSSSSGRSSSNGFTSAIGSSGSSSGKKGFGIKMCPHCGSAVSTKHCAMCGKDNNLF